MAYNGPVPIWMIKLNGYHVPREFMLPSNGAVLMDIRVEGHPELVRLVMREDKDAVPPRFRLYARAHPDWQAWSVQIGGQSWHAADAAPAPLVHPTASLEDIYLGVLELLGREISDATRLQIRLLQQHEILDLPLEGDKVFYEDYSWVHTLDQSFPPPAEYLENSGEDDDEDDDDGGGDDPTEEHSSEDEAGKGDNDGNGGNNPGPGRNDDFRGDSSTLNEWSDNDPSDNPFYLEDLYCNIMAPSGPKAQQQAAVANNTVAAPAPAPAPTNEPPASKGPHPGHIQVSCQYTNEQRLRRMLRDNKSDPAREDSYRLQGVQLIDNVRNVLRVPIKTFDTACVYYHWFRLSFRDAEYNYQDAAMASLFLACKVEDTIKKSKEILCAAYNIKNADHPTTQDDKMFEQPSKIIIGLERLILETVGFDFRCRYPQSVLHKVTKKIMGPDSKDLFVTAMEMSIDLYKTFAPIKQPTFAMAMALLELTARLTDTGVDKIEKVDPADFHTTRQSVVETMLDLLDLYTQHLKSTKLGNRFDLNRFIEVKIVINNEVDNDPKLKRYAHWCNNCDGGEDENLSNGATVLKNISFFGSNSAKRNGRSQDGTMRFVFDPEQARQERREVEPYFRDEFEEYEVEVEVPLEPERQNHNHNHRDKRHDGGGGWGGGGRRNHHDRRKGGGQHRGYY